MSSRISARVDESRIDPGFLTDVLEVLNALPFLFVIHFGWRSVEEQQALRARFEADPAHAPRAARPRQSLHVGENFADGNARAVDVTLVVDGRDEWDYTHPAWRALVDAVKAHPRLHSLDDIGDTDHIQKVGWQSDLA